jgi:hypothetical protein
VTCKAAEFDDAGDAHYKDTREVSTRNEDADSGKS